MEMYEVESSFIRAIGYDPIERLLGVSTCRENGTINIYEYKDVPIGKYAGFWNADSKGAYYNRFIRGKYDVNLIDPEDETVQTRLDGLVNLAPTQLRILAADIIDEAIERLKSWV